MRLTLSKNEDGHKSYVQGETRGRRCGECVRVSTFAWLVMDADGLRLVVLVLVLDAHQMGVRPVVETRPHGKHVLVGLVHGLH